MNKVEKIKEISNEKEEKVDKIKKIKKIKKNISSGIAYVQATFNNTIVTIRNCKITDGFR